MSITTFIMGRSGTGKSTSLRNMAPADTLLIQPVRKPLPFRAGEWKPISKEAPGGNIMHTDKPDIICEAMRRTVRPVIVIDDFQYVMANEFMRRTSETGYQKFTDIGRNAWDILTVAGALADHKRIYILSHTETSDAGETKLKTIGKMLDDKVCLEGMVTIVLKTMVRDGEYLFATKNNGSDTVKSPMGLFEADAIPNDLAAVDAAICEYFSLSAPTT